MSIRIPTAVLIALLPACERENPMHGRDQGNGDAGRDSGPVRHDADSFQLDSGENNWMVDGGESPHRSDGGISDAHINHDSNPPGHDDAHQDGDDAGVNEYDATHPIADAGNGNQNSDAHHVEQEDSGLEGDDISDAALAQEDSRNGDHINDADHGVGRDAHADILDADFSEVGQPHEEEGEPDCILGETEEFYTGPDNARGVGECHEGVATCMNIGGQEMFVVTRWDVIPADELCDGLDNDCNGVADNGFNLDEECEVGQFSCRTVGRMICAPDGRGTVCSAEPIEPEIELCNGEDDDCDGIIDNGFTVGEECSIGAESCRSTGIFSCDENGLGAVCTAEPLQPEPIPVRIFEDLTLQPGPCAYLITDNTLVAQGVTLTIEAGVTILFDGPFQIRVDGTLVASGTPENRITFSSNRENPQPADWDKIRFTDTSVDWDGENGSVIRYADLRYSGSGGDPANATITTRFASPLIEYCRVSEFDTAFLWGHPSSPIIRNNIIENGSMIHEGRTGYIIGVSDGRIENNIIRNNNLGSGVLNGISCTDGSVIVEGNEIVGNSGTAVSGNCNLTISQNIVAENQKGVDVRGRATITGNEFVNNVEKGVELAGAGNSIVFTNNIVSGSDRGMQITHSSNGNESSPIGEFTANVIRDNNIGLYLFMNAPLSLSNNDIYDNLQYAVLIRRPNDLPPHDIQAQNNWWGTVDREEIDEAIYDWNDHFDLARVIYEPIAEVPINVE